MSRIAFNGNALGTGTVTIASPNTNSDRTVTLPDATGTLITNSGTEAISAASLTVSGASTTGSLTVNSNNISAVNSMGFRNRIINGDMRIDQRNAGASVTPANGTYTLDRWAAAVTQASKFTVQQNAGSVTPPSGFTNYLGVTSSSAYTVTSSDQFRVFQSIEGLNIADLAWGTASAVAVTLSFRVYSSLTGTFGGSLANNAYARSYPFTYTISSANTWTTVSVTIPGDTSGTWLTTNGNGIIVSFGFGVGSTLSGTAGAWASAAYVSATGATSVVGTNGATFYITGVQLEAGTVASPFERRDYGRELAMCQRYYWKLKANNTVTNFCTGLNTSTTNARHMVTFPVTMRAAPAAVEQSGTASDYRLWHGSGTTTNLSAVPAFDNANEFTANLSLTVASGLTGGGFSILIANAGTSGYLGWSAEL
jgi:hypothetical protein